MAAGIGQQVATARAAVKIVSYIVADSADSALLVENTWAVAQEAIVCIAEMAEACIPAAESEVGIAVVVLAAVEVAAGSEVEATESAPVEEGGYTQAAGLESEEPGTAAAAVPVAVEAAAGQP